jgi:hypothetical protein
MVALFPYGLNQLKVDKLAQVAIYNLSGYKPLLGMQSPPSRTNLLVREGGLCNISHDLRKVRSWGFPCLVSPYFDGEPVQKVSRK